MDLSVCIQSLITLVPTLVTAGQSVIEIVRTSIKGAGYEFSKELEERIIELEKNKNTDGIIALLKDFEKNCNNTTITQTSHGQGAINVGSGNVTINQYQATDSRSSDELKSTQINSCAEDFIKNKVSDWRKTKKDISFSASSLIGPWAGTPLQDISDKYLGERIRPILTKLETITDIADLKRQLDDTKKISEREAGGYVGKLLKYVLNKYEGGKFKICNEKTKTGGSKYILI